MATIQKDSVILEFISRSEKAQRDINNLDKKVANLGGNFTKASTIAKGFLGAQLFTSAISGTTSLINSGIDLAAQYEKNAIAFEIFSGSAEGAKRILEDIDNLSIRTPFEPEELQNIGKLLLSFGTGVDELNDDLIALGSISAATGSDLGGIGLAFGQVRARGKLLTEELNQLRERGVPVVELLATSLNKSEDEINQLQRSGQITFTQLQKAFRDASREGGKFADSLEKQSQSLAGLRSTLSGAFNNLIRLAVGRFLPAIKEATQGVISFVNRLRGFIEVPVSEKLEEERLELNALVSELGDVNTSQERRNELIKTLNRDYKIFLENLDQENLTNEQLRDRLSEINELYVKRITLQAQEDKIIDIQRRQAKIIDEQFKRERELRRGLIEINEEVGANIDVANVPLETGLRLLRSFLKDVKRARFDTSPLSGIQVPANDAAEALQKLNNLFLDTAFSNKEQEVATRELSEAQKDLNELEEFLGASLEELNKLFGISTEKREQDTKSTRLNTASKKEQLNALEKLNKELKVLEERQINEIAANQVDKVVGTSEEIRQKQKEIKDLKDQIDSFTNGLQIIELEKILEVLEDRAESQLKNSKFFEAGATLAEITKVEDRLNDLRDLRQRLVDQDLIRGDFVKGLGDFVDNRTIDNIDLIRPISLGIDYGLTDEQQAQLQRASDQVKEIQSKLFAELQKEEPNLSLIEGYQRAIENVIKSIESIDPILAKVLSSIELPETQVNQGGNVVAKLLGLDEQGLEQLSGAYSHAIGLVDNLFERQNAGIAKEIELQKRRVDAARDGSAEQLQIEEERLAELEKQRQESANRQLAFNKAITQAQIIINTAQTVSELQTGAARIFKETGIIAPIAVPVTLAIISGILATVGNLFQPPSFFEGTPYNIKDSLGRPRRPGRDGYTINVDGSERVLAGRYNDPIKDIPSDQIPDLVLDGQKFRTIKHYDPKFLRTHIPKKLFYHKNKEEDSKLLSLMHNMRNDSLRRDKTMKSLTKALNKMGVNISIDREGIAMMSEDYQKVEKRKKARFRI